PSTTTAPTEAPASVGSPAAWADPAAETAAGAGSAASGEAVLGETARRVLSTAVALADTLPTGDAVFAVALEHGGALGRRLSQVLEARHPRGTAGAAGPRR